MISDQVKTILFLDDDENMRCLVKVILNRAGYECHTVNSVEAAIIIFKQILFDLILTDVNMPGQNGVEFLEWIKKENPNVPVIIMSGLQNVTLAVQCLKKGATDYITKPFTNQDFLDRIEQAFIKKNDMLILVKELNSNSDFLNQIELIQRLAVTSEYRDEDTYEHIIRVGDSCYTIAKALSLSQEFCDHILLASQLHDIGKIGIPDSILLKPGKLTPDEYEVMKTHTIIGGKILEGSRFSAMKMAHEIALKHHERFNGTGYPFGLKGNEIPLPARIVGLIDVYDALTNERPYKKAWPISQAVDFIRSESGKHFDPDIVDAFHQSINSFAQINYSNLIFPSYA